MLKGLQKAQALKEFRGLRVALTEGGLKGVAKARSLKRFRELRVLLGGENASVPSEPVSNPLYQSVIDGAPITRELLVELQQTAQQEAEPAKNSQLTQATTIAVDFMQGMVQQAMEAA